MWGSYIDGDYTGMDFSSVATAFTPASLKELAGYSLVEAVMDLCLPQKGVFEEKKTRKGSYVKTEDVMPQTRIKELKRIKSWWDDTSWLGALDSPLQRQVRCIFAERLEHVENISSPYRLILQILFTGEAGGRDTDDKNIRDLRRQKYKNSKKILVLSKAGSLMMAEVLKTLGPFSLDSLNTHRMDFEHPAPLIAIIKNSPFLKIVRLYNSAASDYVLKHVGRFCPVLEALTIHYPHIINADKYHYRTFFDGMDKENVLKNVESIGKVPLSFPCLKYVRMQHVSDQFLYILLHFYPDLQFVGLFPNPCWRNLLLPHPQVLKEITNPHKKVPRYLWGESKTNLSHQPPSTAVPRTPCFLKMIKLTFNFLVFQPFEEVLEIAQFYPEVEHLLIAHEEVQFSLPSRKGTCQKLTALIEKLSVTSLSFLNCTTDHLHTYLPTFSEISGSLKGLNLCGKDLEGGEICFLINKCHNLESLKIKLSEGEEVFRLETQAIQVNTMHKLSSLTLMYDESHNMYNIRDYHTFIQSLIRASPNLTKLEIDQAELESVSILIAETNVLNSIRTLGVIGNSCLWETDDFDDSRDQLCQISDMINVLITLRKIILYMPPCHMKYFRNRYQRTALKIIDGQNKVPDITPYDY
ncbi:unnamed protein product [Meganyctiphanes norvegica]|uniref:Uncharacterized protein n=1 Tax=Meganyctiphanes norvegica TaxID=48144 RepID=A0AAV2RF60_MEGNR